jgi:hypothetical protein
MSAYDEDDPPIWARFLIAKMVVMAGALIGLVAGEGLAGVLWGAGLAVPVAMLAFIVPGIFAAILMVLQVFSCAS